MKSSDLVSTARALVADGKGILAADETIPTITNRLQSLNIESTPETRRAYREMLFTTPRIAEFISGVIMHDETLHQETAKGRGLRELLAQQGILPGVKVDDGARPLAGSSSERVTDGLDGLRDRLAEYYDLGARFAKWRAVIDVTDALPSAMCVHANAHSLARYAALCQEQGLVPVVEAEVLMDGMHTIERCEQVTGQVLHAVFNALYDQNVALEGMLLKTGMVIAGKACAKQASIKDVALATLRCMRRHTPAAVPGIVFLSGGQNHLAATTHLNAISHLGSPAPWKISFSFGRALQEEALQTWRGRNENLATGQRAFYNRARCDSAAALGRYATSMESQSAVA